MLLAAGAPGALGSAERTFVCDAAGAALVTAAGAALASLLAGGLPPVGIDDAAITRSYAENVAAGHGYVYYLGGAPVEGATSFLWTSMLALVYAAGGHATLILALAGGLAALATLAALRLARLLAGRLGLSEGLAAGGVAAALLALPGYYAWAVWTMMEVALWSALLLWLALVLVRLVEGGEDRRGAPALLAAATLLPLARPEGLPMATGLILLAAVLAPGAWRLMALGLAASAASFGAVTAWRLWAFGQPFPNTFYAKVSADVGQGLRDGLKYLADFALGSPFADLMIATWLGAALWALIGLRRPRAPGAAGLLLVAALVLGTLSVYAVLGGDHFVLWRFYQPVAPVLPLAAVLGAAAACAALGARAVPAAAAAGALAGVLAPGWMHYRQARFDLRAEFALVERGVGFGRHLNEVDPAATLGVGAAGGIALSYDGPILDLLGLNWPEMAHANPVKEGKRNHASFHAPTFWAHAPDVVGAFERPCSVFAAFDGLQDDARFRAAYRPVRFERGEECWPGFATPAWLAGVAGPGVRELDWSDARPRR